MQLLFLSCVSLLFEPFSFVVSRRANNLGRLLETHGLGFEKIVQNEIGPNSLNFLFLIVVFIGINTGCYLFVILVQKLDQNEGEGTNKDFCSCLLR